MKDSPFFPQSKKIRGLGLTVFCNKCKRNLNELCFETGKKIQQCPFASRHVYKAYIHIKGGGKKRKTKRLAARTANEAIKEAIDFYDSVKEKNNNQRSSVQHPSDDRNESQSDNAPHLLIHAIARYVGWLHNEDVPEHHQKERSKEYIADIERKLNLLPVCLKKSGYDLSSFRVDQINDDVVGLFFKHLTKESGFAEQTIYKHFSYYTSFSAWFSKFYYPIRNYFEGVYSKPGNAKNPLAITREEHEALLKIINSENGVVKYISGVKKERNFYRPYLKDAFRLALETGLRREGLIKMKFKDIIERADGRGFIRVENHKVNNIQKRKTEGKKKYIPVPLTKSLRNLVVELGYGKLDGESYILAPDVGSKRNKVMADSITRGFSHYYPKLNTGRELTFKSYRKAFLTSLSLRLGKNAHKVSGHTTEKILDDYYNDQELMALEISNDFEVLPNNGGRKNEIEQIRNRSINNQKSKTVER